MRDEEESRAWPMGFSILRLRGSRTFAKADSLAFFEEETDASVPEFAGKPTDCLPLASVIGRTSSSCGYYVEGLFSRPENDPEISRIEALGT